MKRELYKRLDVPVDATPEEIKAAFREAIKKAHTDTGGTREDYNAVMQAYDVLKDPKRRRKYDVTDTPDEPIADPDKRSNFLIMQHFRAFLQQPNLGEAPVIATIRAQIANGIGVGHGNIATINAEMRRIKKQFNRIRNKQKHRVHIFEVELESLITNCEKAIIDQEDKIEVGVHALEILNRYEDVNTDPQAMAALNAVLGNPHAP